MINERLHGILRKELDGIAMKGNITSGDLDNIFKLTGSLKNIMKINMMEGDGYSQDGGWMARGNYSRDYERDNSYARRYSRGLDDGRMAFANRIDDRMLDPGMRDEDRMAYESARGYMMGRR